MNKSRKILWFVIVGFFLMMTPSCVEKYWPELDLENERFLVVDGKISNFPGPYIIKLSYSSSILDTLFIPISSAIVSILDDQGNIEILRNNGYGTYITRTNGIQGIVGRSYRVTIQLETGETYESEFEKLLNPIEVDDLIAEEEWQYAQNILEEDRQGFKFYVKTKGYETSNAHFFWEIEETYEYHSAANITHYYDGFMHTMNNQYSLYYCWKTQTLSENFNHSLEGLNLQESHKLPLHFIPYGDERIRFGYNILIKQYVISEDAYTFLHEIEKQNGNQGSLFTTQPYQIRGNIFNTEDQSEIVLGYFTVLSGSNGPRVQVRAPWQRYDNPICYTITSPEEIQNRIDTSTAADWPLYFTDYPFEDPFKPNEFNLIFAYVAPSCLDCRRHGGSTNKPYFWQELN